MNPEAAVLPWEMMGASLKSWPSVSPLERCQSDSPRRRHGSTTESRSRYGVPPAEYSTVSSGAAFGIPS